MRQSLLVVTVLISGVLVWVTRPDLAGRVEQVRGSVVHVAKVGVCQGSGFIVAPDIVVTAKHVTDGTPGTYKVTLDDGTVYGVKAVVEDRQYDIAFLQLDLPAGCVLSPVRLADLSDVRVGDAVFIVGSPYGELNSVTLGILSAKQRDIDCWHIAFQTDSTAAPGSSGGPVFDEYGRVIGVLVGGIEATINYAVPVNLIDLWAVRVAFAQARYQELDLGL